MSTVTNSFNIRFVDHTVCEINKLKKGEVDCANQMLKERIEAKNRLRAMNCLIATEDSTYNLLISYLYEQLKELTSKLIIKI